MAKKEKRYAEALISIASEKNSSAGDSTDYIEIFKQELDMLSQIYNKEATLRKVLLDPSIDKELKKDLLKRIFKSRVKTEILNTLFLLTDKGSISALPGISSEFARLADEKRNILNVEISAYEPLDNDQLDRIVQKIRKQFGAESVKVVVNIDKSLLGGIKIKVGDKVIDSSVSGSLKALGKLLAAR